MKEFRFRNEYERVTATFTNLKEVVDYIINIRDCIGIQLLDFRMTTFYMFIQVIFIHADVGRRYKTFRLCFNTFWYFTQNNYFLSCIFSFHHFSFCSSFHLLRALRNSRLLTVTFSPSTLRPCSMSV